MPDDGGKERFMATFNYEKAFCRNIGILTDEEQIRLRKARVAIAGAGGMGGVYAETLARLGVGSFALADGDTFEVANFNRQAGAIVQNLGKNKAAGLKERILSINPSATVDVWQQNIDESNIAEFLSGANLVMNAVEAFSIASHRLLFASARAHGVPVIFGAPLGFSGAILAFDPAGMSADAYFDWHDGQDALDALANFMVGMAPKALHLGQLNLRDIDVAGKTAPSTITACLAAGSLAVTEACRLLAGRAGARFAPSFVQFDPYSLKCRSGSLRWGCRSPLQRLKKFMLLRLYRKLHGVSQAAGAPHHGQGQEAFVDTAAK
ncbi:MAG: hypothetical protein C0404_01835 [Verrucomicrobia bacterium]|nr:hypothetical protein [Verrucomicrobiota bacterium]